MKPRIVRLVIVVLTLLATFVFSAPCYSQSPTTDGVQRLKQDTGGNVEITWNPQTGTASFVRGQIPIAAIGLRVPVAPATV